MTHVKRLASNLGCITGDMQSLLDCIRFSDPREVIAAESTRIVRTSFLLLKSISIPNAYSLQI